MNKSVPMAAAGFAVLAVVASGLAGVNSASAQGGKGTAPHLPVMRAQVSACSGGALTAMSSRTMDFQSIPAATTADVEGSQWSVKGPKKGTDTVLVTISALSGGGGTGETNSVTLYRDGVGTSAGSKYFAYDTTPASTQFCTKIGKGQHTLTLKLQDSGGGASFLYNTTVTYQRFS
jgi:hypothetical protein